MTMRSRRRRRAAALGAGILSLSLAGCGAVVGITDAPTAAVGGALQGGQAQAIATQAVGAAVAAYGAPGPEGDALRRAAFTGDALEAAEADARLESKSQPAQRQAPKDARALTSAAPVVLAVSRGLAYPRSLVVQTTRAKSGLPVLSLLTTRDVRTPYRVAASATMLPGAVVPAVDPVSDGSPPLADGSGLAVKPVALTAMYAASLAFPSGRPAPAGTLSPDAFAAGVTSSARAQNAALKGVGTFTEQRQARNVAGGLRVADGKGALVFTAIDRANTFLKPGPGTIIPMAPFTALTGLTSVTAEARLKTLEVVTFFIPDSGPAVVVAAQEHLVGASGV